MSSLYTIIAFSSPILYCCLMKTLGEKLKILRSEKTDTTQEELAKYLSTTRSVLSNWETGRTYPDLESLVKLADFFDVSTDYLLCRSDIRKVNYQIDDFLDGLSPSDKQSVKDFIGFLKDRNK
jgi:transcriptional regulator with XRE-family HTH domain